jgi:hypothetical protein
MSPYIRKQLGAIPYLGKIDNTDALDELSLRVEILYVVRVADQL